jgi:hypothetical protein
METQELAEVHIVDKAATGQQDIFLGTVFKEIKVV